MGSFNTLMYKLRIDKSIFFNYFWMSIPTFDDLLRRVEMGLIRKDTKYIRSRQYFVVILWFIPNYCYKLQLTI